MMENMVVGTVASIAAAANAERINESHVVTSPKNIAAKMTLKNQVALARHLHPSSSHRPVVNKHHQYEASIGFIPKEDLAARLIEGYLPTIVIDTRDDDLSSTTCKQIRGALFCPEHCFGPKQVQRLVQKADERRRICNTGISNHKCYVVFYCSKESIKKSLRCAHKFHHALQDMGQLHGITVKVLRGGAESWFKQYDKDHCLVQQQDLDDTFVMDCCDKDENHHGTNNADDGCEM
mmetsp:Transcript_8538/g.16077  ORF Transcript_8538/g.16077 Transcript_8538/m.16077 type:complete len:236 (-) Transcript_8538:1651-2358(-)